MARTNGDRPMRDLLRWLGSHRVLIPVLVTVALLFLIAPYVWKEYSREVKQSRLATVSIVGRGGGYLRETADIAARNVAYVHPGDSTTFELLVFVHPISKCPRPKNIFIYGPCRGMFNGRWRPAKVDCKLLAPPKLEKVEIPSIERELFDAGKHAWDDGGEIPEHHDWKDAQGKFSFSLDGLNGYFHKCSWVVTAPDQQGRHVLVYRTHLSFQDEAEWARYEEDETITAELEVGEPLFNATRVSSYLGIATAAAALYFQVSGAGKKSGAGDDKPADTQKRKTKLRDSARRRNPVRRRRYVVRDEK